MIMAGYYRFMLDAHVSVRLSVVCPLVFLCPDDNLSTCQWIFTKCIDIVIWFVIANGQILPAFNRVICQSHVRIFISFVL